MQSLLFKPEVWQAKQKALDKYGKAVTRRLDGLQVINEDPNRYKLSEPYIIASDGSFHWTDMGLIGAPASCGSGNVFCKPRFHAGQVVFVKEPWAAMSIFDNLPPRKLHDGTPIWYKDTDVDKPTGTGDDMGKWRSPMFMQCRFARHFLKVLSVRPERLQSITEEDAFLEGIQKVHLPLVGFHGTDVYTWEDYPTPYIRDSAITSYAELWDSLCVKEKLFPEQSNSPFVLINSWRTNCWVWRIECERVAQ